MTKSLFINFLLTIMLVSLLSCNKDEPSTIPGDDDFIGGDYFVATWGNDTLPGTKKEPWKTWQKAFNTAEAGDTVYFRGGTWYPTDYYIGNSITIIAPTRIEGIYTGKIYGHDGTAENPICFFAYPPDYEKGIFPTLDCSKVNTEGHEYNNGIEIYTADYIHFKGLTLQNVYQTKINDVAKVASGIGAFVCSNLTFENMTVKNIGGRGFSVSATCGYFGITSDITRWINCDVYNCADLLSQTPGNAGDGWKCDGEAGGYFIFDGCRAWNNSDDGIDPSGSVIAVFNNCWSFSQGFEGALDGNGFKFGGNRGTGAYVDNGILHLGTLVPGSTRIVTNCIAAFNLGSGFYDLEYAPYYRNDSRIYNNISYHNGTGFSGSPNNDFPVNLSKYRNNIAFASVELTPVGDPYNVAIGAVYDENHNSWDAYDPTPGSWPWFVDSDSIQIPNKYFQNLTVAELKKPRKPDGSLPDLKFKEDSKLQVFTGAFVGMSNPAPVGIDWDFLDRAGEIDLEYIENLGH